MPISGFGQAIGKSFHPCFDLYYSKQINKKEVNKFFAKINTGFIFQKNIEILLSFSASGCYYNNYFKRIKFNVELGGGYGASFENSAVATLNAGGVYEVQNKYIPRSQFIILLLSGILIPVKVSATRNVFLTLQARTLLQGPFVKTYVPLLPMNAINFGVVIPLKKETSNEVK